MNRRALLTCGLMAAASLVISGGARSLGNAGNVGFDPEGSDDTLAQARALYGRLSPSDKSVFVAILCILVGDQERLAGMSPTFVDAARARLFEIEAEVIL